MAQVKKIKDYAKPQEETAVLAGRIPVSKRDAILAKMKKDGFRKYQHLLEAMIEKYLAER